MLKKYTDEQINTIEKKFNNPDRKVMCPICGKELQYFRFGNSEQVKCETPGCVNCSVRGL